MKAIIDNIQYTPKLEQGQEQGQGQEQKQGNVYITAEHFKNLRTYQGKFIATPDDLHKTPERIYECVADALNGENTEYVGREIVIDSRKDTITVRVTVRAYISHYVMVAVLAPIEAVSEITANNVKITHYAYLLAESEKRIKKLEMQMRGLMLDLNITMQAGTSPSTVQNIYFGTLSEVLEKLTYACPNTLKITGPDHPPAELLAVMAEWGSLTSIIYEVQGDKLTCLDWFATFPTVTSLVIGRSTATQAPVPITTLADFSALASMPALKLCTIYDVPASYTVPVAIEKIFDIKHTPSSPHYLPHYDPRHGIYNAGNKSTYLTLTRKA